MITAMIAARLAWLGDCWGCRLPSYAMVAQSVRPLVAGKVEPGGVLFDVAPDDPDVADLWCDVLVPAAWTDAETGELDPQLVALDHPDLPTIDPADVALPQPPTP